MTCPPCNNQCAQGKTCPARTARQRAGKPASYELWVAKCDAELEKELERQWKRDLRSIVFIASCIVTFFIIVLVSSK